MAIVFPEGTQNYRNRILQTQFNFANNNVYNNSNTFAESQCNVAITPLESNSTIIIEVNCMQWISGNVYHKQQLRCTGGTTNNDIGTYADVYGSGVSYAGYWLYTHTSHNTTSALTYKIWFTRGYFPNNSNGGNLSWFMKATEYAA